MTDVAPGALGAPRTARPPRFAGLPPIVTFVLWRVLRGLGVLFALSLIAFGLVHLLPGSPVDTLAGPYSDAATRAKLTEDLGLNEPLPVQYLTWLGNTLRGDLGTSVFNGLPVRELIGERLPNTFELAIFATIISAAWGVPAGAIAALRRGRGVDVAARSATFVGLAIPVFVFGVGLVLIFSALFPTWPTLGFVSFADDPMKNLQTMILPSIALGLPLGSTLCRYMRSSMLEVYEQDFIRTALATGSTKLQATLRHGVRNAAAPVATVAGLQMAGIVGNSILIENVFAIPGIGQLTVSAITQHDYAVAQACILVLGATFVLLNFIVDLLIPLIDPKIGRD
ncbi:ABC transporter permease [Nocardioides nitrophenolicus]|uniref:ABC transporter permease n=1 Tax=Nocardioides nitrophenolicus TaxID=60489 RepID=UPI001957DD1E|nr:ABC transporter permease [Nocardioides nitrophenolicus]MBM7517081.1 peptide/nickel transport system permease protein [Nocardioides nitrophenolicus]